MEHAHVWGMHGHWFWLVPLFFMLMTAFFATGLFRGSGRRRYGCCGFGAGPEFRRRDETPREILDRRYANGEISKEEYEEMKSRIDPV